MGPRLEMTGYALVKYRWAAMAVDYARMGGGGLALVWLLAGLAVEYIVLPDWGGFPPWFFGNSLVGID